MLQKLLLILSAIFLFGQMDIIVAAPTPRVQVQRTVDAVIGILQKKDLDRDQRRNALSNVIRQRFDFRAMSRRTLARNWKKATPAERDQFVELFTELLEATYIGRIEAYSNERVVYDKERIRKKKAIVDTHIVTPSVEIPITYKLQLKGEKWLVYDVVVEEVSLIRNFRSSYGDIVKKEGFSGLLAKMETKIRELKNSREAKQEK